MSRRVPEGWHEALLGELAGVLMGQAPPGTSYNGKANGAPLLQGNADFGERHPWPKIWTSQPVRLCAPGDILISVRAPVGELNVADREDRLGRGVAAVRSRGADKSFVYHVLSSAGRHLMKMSTGSTFDAINKDVIEGVPILLPPLTEQQKIAEILGSIDGAIAATRRVIEQTRNLKRALMQELLTRGMPGRHVHFKDSPLGRIPADWALTKFKSLIAAGPQNGLYKHELAYGDGTQIVRIDDFQDGRFTRVAGFKRVRVSEEEQKLYSLVPGDILLNRVNSISHLGKSAVVPTLAQPGIFESNMMRFRCDETQLFTPFAIIWLTSALAKHQIESFAKKAVAQCSISQTDLESFDIAVPSIGEQTEIANLISACEVRSDHEREERSVLEAVRRALGVKLLSGEMRVPLAMGTLKSLATA